jgi:hypothetical protein
MGREGALVARLVRRVHEVTDVESGLTAGREVRPRRVRAVLPVQGSAAGSAGRGVTRPFTASLRGGVAAADRPHAIAQGALPRSFAFTAGPGGGMPGQDGARASAAMAAPRSEAERTSARRTRQLGPLSDLAREKVPWRIVQARRIIKGRRRKVTGHHPDEASGGPRESKEPLPRRLFSKLLEGPGPPGPSYW